MHRAKIILSSASTCAVLQACPRVSVHWAGRAVKPHTGPTERVQGEIHFLCVRVTRGACHSLPLNYLQDVRHVKSAIFNVPRWYMTVRLLIEFRSRTTECCSQLNWVKGQMMLPFSFYMGESHEENCIYFYIWTHTYLLTPIHLFIYT